MTHAKLWFSVGEHDSQPVSGEPMPVQIQPPCPPGLVHAVPTREQGTSHLSSGLQALYVVSRNRLEGTGGHS